MIDNMAGPGEFLGYIHGADYVITNSFHGTAFSIIYEKQFLVFQHSSLGARISNLLEIHGLEGRLYDRSRGGNIDSPIDWGAVREKTAEQVEKSGRFLMENIPGSVRQVSDCHEIWTKKAGDSGTVAALAAWRRRHKAIAKELLRCS